MVLSHYIYISLQPLLFFFISPLKFFYMPLLGLFQIYDMFFSLIVVYTYICMHKHGMLSLYNVTCMYIFRDDPLVLSNQLVDVLFPGEDCFVLSKGLVSCHSPPCLLLNSCLGSRVVRLRDCSS